ncbi:hypothetical protein BA022_08000 [Diaphorobacter nitroreducens]|uniref:hypothetical protein n=1 Tax=Diaphorobacter nitroreducens TaxID=164759 RepID=UPI000B5A1326|nr:hypothetical protein [Diaphorobacter nitroreducens]ASI68503.1 hypothetical protein BA022_08000 [Diaphorobacter nitroreducens]
MSQVRVEALTSFEHNGTRRPGEFFEVSPQHAEQLQKKRLCVIVGSQSNDGGKPGGQAKTLKSEQAKREPKAPRAPKAPAHAPAPAASYVAAPGGNTAAVALADPAAPSAGALAAAPAADPAAASQDGQGSGNADINPTP